MYRIRSRTGYYLAGTTLPYRWSSEPNTSAGWSLTHDARKVLEKMGPVTVKYTGAKIVWEA